jgi:hypothetical protein
MRSVIAAGALVGAMLGGSAGTEAAFVYAGSGTVRITPGAPISFDLAPPVIPAVVFDGTFNI